MSNKRVEELAMGLKNPQFMRLHHKAGGLSLKSNCYEALREISVARLESILHNAVIHSQSRKAKTINEADVRYAIKVSGHHMSHVL